ncbi:hypothetical protein COMA2_60106 [Candidatus Nitrospira nitrificans]|uniref:Uncharacterized protein n=1 Tax=Candidatus Nitrospira nitrificans TaxID=1742973 RepID=A0A0S4LVI1_9BACT|nr:hypothetical protein COMA2_60106 [Candidatus Nitrospira nitrificans]
MCAGIFGNVSYATAEESDDATGFIAVFIPGTHGSSRLTIGSHLHIQIIEWKTPNLTTLRRRCFAHARSFSLPRIAIHETGGHDDALRTA